MRLNPLRFDLLENINMRARLQCVYSEMEVELYEFKKKYPDSPKVVEAQKKIDELRELYKYVAELQEELNYTRRVSSENSLNNLVLSNRLEEANKEVDKLNKVLSV